MTSIWKHYEISFHFYDKLCASVPANPELIKAWLENQSPRVRPAGGRSLDQIQEEVWATIALAEEEDQEQKSLLIFQRIDGKLVVRAGTTRAHIKECARTISAQHVGKIKGERSFATKVVNGVYHDEKQYWLPILNPAGTEQVTKADGIHEKPVRFRLPDGRQMSALKAFEYVTEPVLRFRLKVLGTNPGLKDLTTIFEYGGVHGFGGERGDGEGRYHFEIKEE